MNKPVRVGDILILDRQVAHFNRPIAQKILDLNHPWLVRRIMGHEMLIYPMTTNLSRAKLPNHAYYTPVKWREAGMNREGAIAASDVATVPISWAYKIVAHLTPSDLMNFEATAEDPGVPVRILESLTNSNATAWMIRNDGHAFPVEVHLYSDGDWVSLADIASFIISTNSRDKDYMKQAIIYWMTSLLEDQDQDLDKDSFDMKKILSDYLQEYPEYIKYPLSIDDYMKIYNSVDHPTSVAANMEWLESIDFGEVESKVLKSLNQQFCRARFGGQYDTNRGNPTMWFRISSAGFNWYNIIYKFTYDYKNKLGIKYVTICRDPESDEMDTRAAKFYKTKDGGLYKDMPVDEFLSEEHGSNPVFESFDPETISIGIGIRRFTRIMLCTGHTLIEMHNKVPSVMTINFDKAWNVIRSEEIRHRVFDM